MIKDPSEECLEAGIMPSNLEKMDKEAIGKIANLLCVCGDDPLLEKPPERYILADRILGELRELGYRKPPKGEPPLLSKDKMSSIEYQYIRGDSFYYGGACFAIAQAQKEADIKWYERQ